MPGIGAFGGSPVLAKVGRRYSFDDIEFWAEEGTICIEHKDSGDCTVVYRQDFAKRAQCLNFEAKHPQTTPSDRVRLQNAVIDMHEAWTEAKNQGDPTDREVMRQKLRERKRAILVPSCVW